MLCNDSENKRGAKKKYYGESINNLMSLLYLRLRNFPLPFLCFHRQYKLIKNRAIN